MKKLTLIISALALVFGMSQCTKKPNQPLFGVHSQSLKLSTGNGNNGAKGDFQEDVENLIHVLNYKWSSGDVLYVYAQNGGEKFDGGYFLGKMGLTQIQDEAGYKATFEGMFDNIPNEGWLRFVHYGGDVVVNENGSAFVDLSKQNGKRFGDNSVSRKVVAYIDRPINTEGVYENCDLEVQFAVMKLDLSNFSDKVYLSCILKNGINVSDAGVITSEDGLYETFTGVSSSSTDYYVAVMEIDNTKPIKFSDATQSGEITAGMVKNKFYTDNGNSIKIATESYPEGTLPGIFTNGDRTSIHFSKGNLYYDGSWHFENNQYNSEYIISGDTVWNQNHISHFFWCGNASDAILGEYNPSSAIAASVLFTNDPTDRKKANPSFSVDGVAGKFRSNYLIGNETSKNNEMKVILWDRFVKNSDNVKKISHGYGKVEGVRGMFLLPDYWDYNECENFYYGSKIIKEGGRDVIDYNVNVFSSTSTPTWAEMENAGVVFFPAVGYRDAWGGKNNIRRYDYDGHYWMSNDYLDAVQSRGFYFNETNSNPSFIENKYVAYPIRLVCDR